MLCCVVVRLCPLSGGRVDGSSRSDLPFPPPFPARLGRCAAAAGIDQFVDELRQEGAKTADDVCDYHKVTFGVQVWGCACVCVCLCVCVCVCGHVLI